MKTLSLKAKLINCFFALTLVTGLCVPSLASYAYAEPSKGTVVQENSTQVEDVFIEGEETYINETETGDDGKVENGPEVTDPTQNAANLKDTLDKPAEEPVVETQSNQITPLATEVTDWADVAGSDFQVKSASSGNISVGASSGDGSDCYFEGTILHIQSSKPIAVKNKNEAVATAHTIQIDAGVQADLTLAGVSISTGNSAPINMINNVMDTPSKTRATYGDEIIHKTMLYLTIADGTTNNLANTNTTRGAGWPGIRCGWGSVLVIDDEKANIKVGGSKFNLDAILIPKDGMVAETETLLDGSVVSKGKALTEFESDNPGSLYTLAGSCAASIGGALQENSGTIVINGGKLTNHVYYKYSGDDSGGAGIGGGNGGSGTKITINGGEVDAVGGCCGAAIGGSYTGAGVRTNFGTPKPDTIEIPTSRSTTNPYGYYNTAASGGDQTLVGHYPTTLNSTSNRFHSVGGDITINGGFVTAAGSEHGNAIGQGCAHGAASNTEHIIKITGGTVVTSVKSTTSTNPKMYCIGGLRGYTIVTGGSVYVDSIKEFQGIGDTAFNTQGINSWTDVINLGGKLPDKDKVQMIAIDLSSEFKSGENKTVPITKWQLEINNEVQHYGAPSYLDGGKLYLWVPKDADGKKVTVTLSYKDDAGVEHNIEPMYVEEVGGSQGSLLKRYIDIDIKKLPDEQKGYFSSLQKEYDGLPFEAFDVEHNPINTAPFEANGKILNDPDYVTISHQAYDAIDGDPLPGSSVESTGLMPANTGTFKVELISKQYATADSDFSKSYWGHRITGWAQVTPVPAVVNLTKVEWGNLKDDGSWEVVDSTEQDAGNRIKVDFNIRSKVGTALTCGVPTGQFQLMVDNVPVGESIDLTQEAIGSKSENSFSTKNSQFTKKEDNTADKMNSFDDQYVNGRARVDVTYFFDPTKTDGLLDALDKAAQATYAAALAEGDSEEEAADKANEHQISVLYIPDKNYVEGVENNEANKDDGQTVIIPVDPSTPLIPDGSVTPDDDPKEDPITPPDQTDGVDVVQQAVVAKYSDFHAKDDPVKQDFFTVDMGSKSAMPIECYSTNPAVVDYVKDENGNPVFDKDGKIQIKINSCGVGVIVMKQAANALYRGQVKELTVTVIPDPAIIPETEVRVVWENTTHPGLPAAPGDVLEYTVIGSNLTEGSSWQNVVLGDEFSKDLELVPNSVKIAKNFTTPDNLETLNAEDFGDVVFSDLASNKYQATKDSITLNSDAVNSIYGGQSSAFKFQVKVKDNLTDRKTMTGDNPPTIPNTPTVDGNYGVTETDKLVPGEKPDETPKALDGDNATKVYPIEADEIPEAVVIPKDPILPGTDPADPDNPSGDNKSDISVVKSAKNLTHPEGNKALVGDTIEYSITVENKGKDTCYYWPVIKDTLPLGLKPIAGSFELTKVDGTTIAVSDSCYQASTHTISLYVDDLYGNEKTTLSFKCTVTPEATDIANTAQVIGTTPSDKWKGEHPDPVVEPDDAPDTSYIKFDANGGEGAPVGIEGQTSNSITTPFPTTEPTREGYEFVGWNTQANGTGLGITSYPSKFLSKPGSIYYYAQWKKATNDDPGKDPGDPTPEDPTQFSYILFAANGGTNAPEGIKGEPNSTITNTFPTEEPTAPEGYEFVGWFTEKTGGNKVEGYPSEFLATTDADNNVKPTTTYYYAHWQKIGNPDDTTPPASDPDPINPLEFTYIKFDANGGKFVTPVTAQAEGDTTIPTWSTQGLTGTPNGTISDVQKKTFPSKEYGPVERKGYTFTGWNTKADGTGEEVTAYGNTLPASGTTYYYAQWVKDPEPTWPPTPGQPFSPDPKIPASEYPWDDPDNPFDWDKYLENNPKIDTPEPADVGKVMPADPDYKDLRITLSAKNETRMDGYTYVGDEVTYTILIENLSTSEKSWLDVIARADIPEGLKFMPGSIYLTTPQGEVIHVNDNAYNEATRILALNAGDLAGGQTVKVVFKAEVTIDAINKDIGMTSYAYGTLPSEFDVNDESYVKPEPGTAFDPGIGGWALYDFNHKSIFNPEKVYPSKYVTAQKPPLGTPEQQAEAAKLAKTGDTTALVALGVGVIAVAAGAALVLARRRMKKSGR